MRLGVGIGAQLALKVEDDVLLDIYSDCTY